MYFLEAGKKVRFVSVSVSEVCENKCREAEGLHISRLIYRKHKQCRDSGRKEADDRKYAR